MPQSAIFAKTEVGLLELKNRSARLDQRCRSLLLLIDGKVPAHDVIARLAGLGITREHFQKLLDLGCVAPVVEKGTSVPTAVQAAPLQGPVPERRAAVAPVPVTVNISNADKFIAVGNFMNQTAKDLMGLFAAVSFQQKVSRASSLDDLKALRQPMLDAITKAKGESIARGMAMELDRVMGD